MYTRNATPATRAFVPRVMAAAWRPPARPCARPTGSEAESYRLCCQMAAVLCDDDAAGRTFRADAPEPVEHRPEHQERRQRVDDRRAQRRGKKLRQPHAE